MKMKIAAFTLLAIFTVFTVSCRAMNEYNSSTSGSEATDSATSLNTTSSNENTTIYITAEPIRFSSVSDLVEKSDIILIGQVTGSAINRIDLAKDGYVEASEPLCVNVTSFYIDVIEVIKGSTNGKNQIKVDSQIGGLAGGVQEVYNLYIDPPEIGKTHIFFFRCRDERKGSPYFEYIFRGTYDRYAIIDGEMIIPQNKDSVFNSGSYTITDIESILENSD